MTVEIAFASAPGDETPTWTDVSAYLKAASTKRGRSRELDQFEPGSCSLTLDNRDRRFDPDHATGPYFGNLLPLKRLRVLATYSAVVYPVFDGFVDSIVQSYSPPQNAEAIFSATDAFKVLALTSLEDTPYRAEVAFDGPTLRLPMDEAAGVAGLEDSQGNAWTRTGGTLGVAGLEATVSNHTAWASLDTTTDKVASVSDGGVTTTDFTVELLIKTTHAAGGGKYFFTQNGTLAGSTQVRFDLLGGTGLLRAAIHGSSVSSLAAVNDGLTHHVALGRSGGVASLFVDGVLQGTFASSGAVTAGPLILGVPDFTNGVIGTYDEFAIYDRELSSTRIAAHAAARSGAAAWGSELSGARLNRILDLARFPAADRSIDAGDTSLLASTLGTSTLAHAQKVAESEAGSLFVSRDGKVRFIARSGLSASPYVTSQATFGDSGAELGYVGLVLGLDEQELINQVRAQNFGGIEQVATDAASVTAFFLRERSRTGLLTATDAETLARAQYEVATHKDPATRVDSITLAPAGAPATLWPQALGRELADKVTVLRRPQGVGAAIEKDLRIEGIAHTVVPKGWRTDWLMSPAEVGAMWLLDVTGASELDETTVLGF